MRGNLIGKRLISQTMTLSAPLNLVTQNVCRSSCSRSKILAISMRVNMKAHTVLAAKNLNYLAISLMQMVKSSARFTASPLNLSTRTTGSLNSLSSRNHFLITIRIILKHVSLRVHVMKLSHSLKVESQTFLSLAPHSTGVFLFLGIQIKLSMSGLTHCLIMQQL